VTALTPQQQVTVLTSRQQVTVLTPRQQVTVLTPRQKVSFKTALFFVLKKEKQDGINVAYWDDIVGIKTTR
jgi:hypothetical protein